jgi:hypothetical protein
MKTFFVEEPIAKDTKATLASKGTLDSKSKGTIPATTTNNINPKLQEEIKYYGLEPYMISNLETTAIDCPTRTIVVHYITANDSNLLGTL